ncbi:MAG: ADP-glyceromanno-heptose 6-epimerase [Candidatus Omnitrophica bacterium]|nr:ADP-glyceromanno-heptose 6-epimerase [Candidatus Omnitrophota bacterium]MCM8801968.1 ADP-glyceromanno-heptose 6-epimerase [Candidatus Omnitrophota bacterium]
MRIILTGGAGFIGSCFLSYLNKKGINDIVLVDRLNQQKKKNIENKKFNKYYDKDEFLLRIVKKFDKSFDFLIHLGACTNTRESNFEYVIKNNFIYSKKLALFCLENNIEFIYASSAATYGKEEKNFLDDENNIENLVPLNLYGLSKNLFDMWVVLNKFHINFVGLKFFNVYGPNETHKEEMRSIISKGYEQIKKTGKIRLFKSYKEDYKDGEQKRDFVYVMDVCDVIWFFMENRDKKGIYNVGTGKARSFNDVAKILFKYLNKKENIEYIDMPEDMRDKYQYFTQANIEKLRKAGYKKEFLELEDGVKEFISVISLYKS